MCVHALVLHGIVVVKNKWLRVGGDVSHANETPTRLILALHGSAEGNTVTRIGTDGHLREADVGSLLLVGA